MKLTSSNAFSRQDLILKGYSHLKLLESVAENFMGKVGTCIVCGKEKTMVSQRNRDKIDVGVVDTYLECKDLRKNRQLKCFCHPNETRHRS